MTSDLCQWYWSCCSPSPLPAGFSPLCWFCILPNVGQPEKYKTTDCTRWFLARSCVFATKRRASVNSLSHTMHAKQFKLYSSRWQYQKVALTHLCLHTLTLHTCRNVGAYSMWSVCVCLLRSYGDRFLPESQLQVMVLMSEVTQRIFLGFWGGTTVNMHTYTYRYFEKSNY